MLLVIRRLKVQLQGEQGQDLVEYGLLMAFVSLAGIAAIAAFGQTLFVYWNWVSEQLALVFH